MAGYQMSDYHKGLLRTNRVYLTKNILPASELLDHLYGTKILTEDMKEEIEVEKTKKSKIGKLLDILPRRGPEAFKNFIFGLMESEQEYAALKLDEDLASGWKAENGTSSPKSKQTKRTPPMPAPCKPKLPAQSLLPAPTPPNESAILKLDVQPVDLDDTNILKLINNTKDVYEMKRKPRGRALIINNSYFVNSPSREGATFDSLNLCEHLEQLGFKTSLFDDISADDIKAVCLEESENEGHWNADCILVFVLSHGSQGFIYGIDGKKVSIENDIVAQFDGNKCKALVNKPKMFFIQACQGDAVTEGSSPRTGDSEVDASPINDSLTEVEQAMRDLQIQDTEQTLPTLSRTHEKSDIVLAYSTVPGYRSWRRTDLGSWFVRAIVEVFSAEACKEDLLSLLVKVRQRVAELHTYHEDKSFIQLTRTDETTKKKIYFFPGYYETQTGDRV